jgi:NIMA (never in mitosis gene a)-related kinase
MIGKPFHHGYFLESKFGEGGYGQVFKAETLVSKLSAEYIPICIKKIDLSAEDIISQKKKFNQAAKEVEILKALDHPNIVKYLHDFEENDNFFIAMELVEGNNLS